MTHIEKKIADLEELAELAYDLGFIEKAIELSEEADYLETLIKDNEGYDRRRKIR